MPLLDLSNASAVRWNGKDVSAIRLNGVDLWTPEVIPEAPTTFSVFGASVPGALTSYSDADPNSWISNQFYVGASSGYSGQLVGARLYVPPGSMLIDLAARMAFMRRTAADGGAFQTTLPYGWFDTNGTKTELPAVLKVGWNEVLFPDPYPLNPGDVVVIGYQVSGGNYYLHNASVGPDPIQDVSNKGVYLAEFDRRSFYRGDSTPARWYGTDLLFQDA